MLIIFVKGFLYNLERGGGIGLHLLSYGAKKSLL